MDILDTFLKKYSYKFPKGYPDMNNEQDIKLLASLLEGLDINLNEEIDNQSLAIKNVIGDINIDAELVKLNQTSKNDIKDSNHFLQPIHFKLMAIFITKLNLFASF